ncbi:hypothetical protein [Photorhabdus namnaonensis]|uniref:Uncharacterized protein n=1 Tax=Photorhabdus namnaonensis TaxID=1851568 RepID=A0A1B8YN29_9GAMM|nr:hypothetical protein [Photorhabdus namnaonensis]OCA56560.1 hypothetical protein Phpb_00291 [Photorhabdus namnaonensis]
MKKLFKLKEWFTLGETARRLTSSFEEEISIADCLSLALDKRLMISVLLDKSVYAVKAKLIKTTMRKQFSDCIKSTTNEGAVLNMLVGERFYTNEQLDHEYEEIEREDVAFKLPHGIYDLPMIGAEELDVMHTFDTAQSRSPREYVNIEGAFLNTKFGMVNILASFNKLTLEYNDKELALFDSVKNEFVDYKNYHNFFYPDDGLGDVEFICRREHIEKLEQSVLNDGEAALALDDSLLIIGSMLSALKKAKPESKRWTQDALKGELEKTCPISARTLDKYFSEANKRLKSVN